MAINPFIAFMAFVAFNRWDVIIGIPAGFPKQKKKLLHLQGRNKLGGEHNNRNNHKLSHTIINLEVPQSDFPTLFVFDYALLSRGCNGILEIILPKKHKNGKNHADAFKGQTEKLGKENIKKHGWISRVPVPPQMPAQMPAVHQDSSMHIYIYKYHQISILKVGGEMPTLQAYRGNNQHLQNKLG